VTSLTYALYAFPLSLYRALSALNSLHCYTPEHRVPAQSTNGRERSCIWLRSWTDGLTGVEVVAEAAEALHLVVFWATKLQAVKSHVGASLLQLREQRRAHAYTSSVPTQPSLSSIPEGRISSSLCIVWRTI
jgi:hypothetical protein